MTVPVFTWRHALAPDGALQMLPSSTVDGVTFKILDFSDPLDLALVEWTPFEAARVGQDGMAYFGGVFSAGREMTIPIWCQCGSFAKALDTINALHVWFANSSTGVLRVTRTRADSTPFGVEAQCYVSDRRGFIQNHAEAAAGIVGDADAGNLLYVVKLCAPYPHFRGIVSLPDGGASGQFPTDSVVSLTNGCPNEIGVTFSLEAVGGTILSATVRNNTTGRYITVTDDLSSTVSVDWFGANHNSFQVDKGAVSIIEKINPGAKLKLVPGVNIIQFLATGTGATYNWEMSFIEEYDSI